MRRFIFIFAFIHCFSITYADSCSLLLSALFDSTRVVEFHDKYRAGDKFANGTRFSDVMGLEDFAITGNYKVQIENGKLKASADLRSPTGQIRSLDVRLPRELEQIEVGEVLGIWAIAGEASDLNSSLIIRLTNNRGYRVSLHTMSDAERTGVDLRTQKVIFNDNGSEVYSVVYTTVHVRTVTYTDGVAKIGQSKPSRFYDDYSLHQDSLTHIEHQGRPWILVASDKGLLVIDPVKKESYKRLLNVDPSLETSFNASILVPIGKHLIVVTPQGYVRSFTLSDVFNFGSQITLKGGTKSSKIPQDFRVFHIAEAATDTGAFNVIATHESGKSFEFYYHVTPEGEILDSY